MKQTYGQFFNLQYEEIRIFLKKLSLLSKKLLKNKKLLIINAFYL
jgi:hypothetical protein